MIPQIELSYYTNSLSLLSIQHPFAKGQSHARNDSTKTPMRARTRTFAQGMLGLAIMWFTTASKRPLLMESGEETRTLQLNVRE